MGLKQKRDARGASPDEQASRRDAANGRCRTIFSAAARFDSGKTQQNAAAGAFLPGSLFDSERTTQRSKMPPRAHFLPGGLRLVPGGGGVRPKAAKSRCGRISPQRRSRAERQRISLVIAFPAT